jgi:hypothetical protein
MVSIDSLAQQLRAPHFFLVLLLAVCLTACAPQIGDACDSDQDCPAGVICDRSVEGGLCTIRNCRPSTCPSESICVVFDRHEAYCMRSCTSDEECRADHRCLLDEEKGVSYCFVDD